MLNEQNWRWLVRYLADECSEREKSTIEKWITSNPELRKEIANLQKIWNTSAEEKEDWDLEEAWKRFKRHNLFLPGNRNYDKIPVQPHHINTYPKSGTAFHKRDSVYKWITLMAAVAAAVVISFLFFSPHNNPPKEHKIAMREIAANKGERVHLLLSDGTRVLLNADSRLKIPQHFSDTSRNVYLEGEAYFDVAHHAGKPFIVHAGHTVTRDLSTRFVVMAYSGSKRTRVIVAEGKVAMRDQMSRETTHSDAIITRNHIGIATEDGTIQISHVKNLMNWVGWTKGKLVFSDTPLSQIIPRLERWYDLNITLSNPALANRRLTATYVDNQPMAEVIDAIALSLHLKYTIKNQSLVTFSVKKITEQ